MKRTRDEMDKHETEIVDRTRQIMETSWRRMARYSADADMFTPSDLINMWQTLSDEREAIKGYEQGSQEWLDTREKLIITATRIASIIREKFARSKAERNAQPIELVRDMLCPVRYSHEYLRYGTENEDRCCAIGMLRVNWLLWTEDPTWNHIIRSKHTGLQIMGGGNGMLGISNDGEIRWPTEKGLKVLVECKCAAATKRLPYPHPWSPYYYPQVQYMMGLLRCSFCYGMIYTPTGSRLVRIDFNPVYFRRMMDAAKEWILEMLMPAALRYFNLGTFPSWVPGIESEVEKQVSEDGRKVPEDPAALTRWVASIDQDPLLVKTEDQIEHVLPLLRRMDAEGSDDLSQSWCSFARNWSQFTTIPKQMPPDITDEINSTAGWRAAGVPRHTASAAAVSE